MDGKRNNALQVELISLAQECADEVAVEDLARTVGGALFDLSNVCLAGVAVFDEERQAVQRYTAVRTQSPHGQQDEEFAVKEEEVPAEATEIPALLNGQNGYVISPLNGRGPTLLKDRRAIAGASQYLSVSISLQDRLLGTVYAAFSTTDEISDDTLAFTSQLARIVTPVLYNCLNHARFARGDRRRDALIELGKVLNSSLELETVMTHARRVVGSLEGHCASSICLLNEGNRTYHSYQTHGRTDKKTLAMPGSSVHQVKGSVLGWLLEHGSIYESDDLEKECRFDDEHDLRKRGVKRYLAVPLQARGRILGAFMFGTQDPRPRRKVEYWLYENMALQLALAIDNAVKHEKLQSLTKQLADQNAYLREEIEVERGFGAMIGQTAAMEALRTDILRVAATDAAVLITGETGVGKELVARNIHEHSTRSGQAFIKVNCPGIAESMVESELFGHEKGAFTSAVERRIGRFELGLDGTLFLDEIGELPLTIQAKLLRVLQDGEFERVGGSKTLKSNARIVAATNRDLAKAIDDHRFRSDLYFRLNVFPIHVPPLRERRDDIPALVETFISDFSQRLGKRLERIDKRSLDELCRRYWPGNIRELRHVIERAAILSDGPCLHVEPDNSDIMPPPDTHAVAQRSSGSLNDVQAEHIRRTLERCGGVIEGVNGAAALLGLKPSTLRFRMKRLGIRRPE